MRRIIFFDCAYVLNTIQPLLLAEKLLAMQLDHKIKAWITDQQATVCLGARQPARWVILVHPKELYFQHFTIVGCIIEEENRG